ncbi:MAG: glycosyltransferase family 4 protein [Chrysiogenia bacterium]
MRSHSLARQLVKRGHKVTLVAGSETPRIRRWHGKLDDVDVLQPRDWLPLRFRHGGLSLIDILDRILYVRAHRFDLVHGFCHRPSVSLPALYLKIRASVPVVIDWADIWGYDGIAGERRWWSRWTLGRLDDILEKWTLSSFDGLTVINDYLLQRAANRGISKKQLVLSVGANIDRIHPLPKAEMRRRWGLPVQASIAVHSGFSSFDSIFLAAAAKIWLRGDPRGILVLSGGEFPEVMAMAEKEGLQRRVIHFGRLPYHRLGEILACGDVLLLPYSNRSVNLGRFPSKFCDFLAAGRPVVTQRTAEVGRLVLEKNVGVAAESSPAAFAEAIRLLLDQPERTEAMGRRARSLADEHFSWGRIVDDLEIFYREILRGEKEESGRRRK